MFVNVKKYNPLSYRRRHPHSTPLKQIFDEIKLHNMVLFKILVDINPWQNVEHAIRLIAYMSTARQRRGAARHATRPLCTTKSFCSLLP